MDTINQTRRDPSQELTEEFTSETRPQSPQSPQSSENLHSLRQHAEDYAREQPAKALGIAMGVGFFFSIIPVFRVCSGVLRLLIVLLKPVLLCLGGIKLYEEISKRYDN